MIRDQGGRVYAGTGGVVNWGLTKWWVDTRTQESDRRVVSSAKSREKAVHIQGAAGVDVDSAVEKFAGLAD